MICSLHHDWQYLKPETETFNTLDNNFTGKGYLMAGANSKGSNSQSGLADQNFHLPQAPLAAHGNRKCRFSGTVRVFSDFLWIFLVSIRLISN